MLKAVRKVIWLVPLMASQPVLDLGSEFDSPWRSEVMQNESSVPKCSTPADCNARGTKALQAERFDEADSLFRQELQLAEDGDEAATLLLALNNLAVSSIHHHDYLMARAWIRTALHLDSANPATIHNLQVAEANLKSFRWPSSPNGTYLQYVHCGDWNEIRITDASSTHAKLAFSGLRAGTQACSDFAPSLGELEGQVALRGKSAIYTRDVETGPCRIEIVFHGGSLSVQQEGRCGFGHGVYAAGEYQRVSAH
jgi:hypothetical protein